MDVGVAGHSDQAGADRTAALVQAAGPPGGSHPLDTSALDSRGDVTGKLGGRLGGKDMLTPALGAGMPTREMTAGQWRHLLTTYLRRVRVHLVRQSAVAS